MDGVNLPHRRGAVRTQMTLCSTEDVKAWIMVLRERPPVLCIDALNSELRLALPHFNTVAELGIVRQVSSVFLTFAELTESGWLTPHISPPRVPEEVLRGAIAGLRRLR